MDINKEIKELFHYFMKNYIRNDSNISVKLANRLDISIDRLLDKNKTTILSVYSEGFKDESVLENIEGEDLEKLYKLVYMLEDSFFSNVNEFYNITYVSRLLYSIYLVDGVKPFLSANYRSAYLRLIEM